MISGYRRIHICNYFEISIKRQTVFLWLMALLVLPLCPFNFTINIVTVLCKVTSSTRGVTMDIRHRRDEDDLEIIHLSGGVKLNVHPTSVSLSYCYNVITKSSSLVTQPRLTWTMKRTSAIFNTSELNYLKYFPY